MMDDIKNLIERLKIEYHGASTVENNPDMAFSDLVASLTALTALEKENARLRAELDRVKRERDAAVEDIEALMRGENGVINTCKFCVYKKNPACGPCDLRELLEGRMCTLSS